MVEVIEYRHFQADGTYIWVESVASSNPTPNGCSVISTRDISDRKRRQKELERANERIEEVAGTVSHVLRDPLGVAEGYLELAEKDSPTEHRATVSDALDWMETLIDMLLRNTRIEAQKVNGESIDFARLCRNRWRNIVSEDAALPVDVARPFHVDVLPLPQLLENLFRIAIDHGGDGVVISVGGTR